MSEKTIENYMDQLIMREYLDQLDKQDRQIIVLYYWWGYRDTEIGEISGLSQQVVHYRRKKSIKQIKGYMIQSNIINNN